MEDTIVVIAAIVTGVTLLLAAALVLRSLFLWFWRINDLVALLRRQNELLAKIAGEPVEPEPTSAQPASLPPR